jgi:hypothetical protein
VQSYDAAADPSDAENQPGAHGVFPNATTQPESKEPIGKVMRDVLNLRLDHDSLETAIGKRVLKSEKLMRALLEELLPQDSRDATLIGGWQSDIPQEAQDDTSGSGERYET